MASRDLCLQELAANRGSAGARPEKERARLVRHPSAGWPSVQYTLRDPNSQGYMLLPAYLGAARDNADHAEAGGEGRLGGHNAAVETDEAPWAPYSLLPWTLRRGPRPRPRQGETGGAKGAGTDGPPGGPWPIPADRPVDVLDHAA